MRALVREEPLSPHGVAPADELPAVVVGALRVEHDLPARDVLAREELRVLLAHPLHEREEILGVLLRRVGLEVLGLEEDQEDHGNFPISSRASAASFLNRFAPASAKRFRSSRATDQHARRGASSPSRTSMSALMNWLFAARRSALR